MTPARCVVAFSLALAILAAGCGGGDEPTVAYTVADARRIASVRPVTPGWPPWPQSPEEKQPSSRSPDEATAEDPILAEYRRATAGLGDVRDGEQSNQWQDDDKLGNLIVQVFRSPTEASTGFAAFNAFSRAYADELGTVTKAEAIEGLGDEAWVLWASWNGQQVTYHWRRDNLVIEAHVHCFGVCAGDVDASARHWVDAIDAEAQAES